MLLALMAVAALAAAEPADAAVASATPEASAPTGSTEVAPVTVPGEKPQTAKAKKTRCVRERPTGSNRTQLVCYDTDRAERSRDDLYNHGRNSAPNVGGFGATR